jgi:nucleoside-diphosphate-sugar epimerase
MQEESGKFKAVFSAVMPPNICGPGKIPLDHTGDRDINAHKSLASGNTVYLPEGPEALIGPCDAEDLATLFMLVINKRENSASEIFNGGSDYSLTATEFVRAYGKIYNVEVPIEYISWEKFTSEVAIECGAWWHFYAHMQPDISKAKRLLGYNPKYTPEETMARAVAWMKEENLI